MKYLCEWCERLADAARFRLEGAELVVACSKCGAETRTRATEPVASSAAAGSVPAMTPVPSPPTPPAARVVPLHAVPPPPGAAEDPFAVPEGRCPKCVAPRPAGAFACAQCGLVFDNFVSGEYPLSPELKDAWLELAARWDDLAAHDRALGQAAGRGELATMGRLYRIRLARQPQDPMALRGRDEVLRRAANTSPFLAARPSGARGDGGGAGTWRMVLLVMMMVLGMGAFFFAWQRIVRG